MREKIIVRDLCVFYGKNEVLRGVNVSIPENAVTALVGPSGCGKSTFLKCLNRLIDEEGAETRGSVRLEGEELLSDSVDLPALRRRVGMVFQTPALFPGSIFDNVAYGVRLHERLSRVRLDQRVKFALKKAALLKEVENRLHEPADRLSGGQRQRLCIARALAVEPQVLLLDEPTSALDPVAVFQIEKLLTELRGHMTIVIVTHNIAQGRRIADRCAFFSKKTILQAGPASLLTGTGACPELKSYLENE